MTSYDKLSSFHEIIHVKVIVTLDTLYHKCWTLFLFSLPSSRSATWHTSHGQLIIYRNSSLSNSPSCTVSLLAWFRRNICFNKFQFYSRILWAALIITKKGLAGWAIKYQVNPDFNLYVEILKISSVK